MREGLKVTAELPYGYEVHHMTDHTQYTDLFEDTDQTWLASGEHNHQFTHFQYEHFIMYESPLEDFEPHTISLPLSLNFSFRKVLTNSIYQSLDYELYPDDERNLFEFSPFATFIHNIFSYAADTRLRGFSTYLSAAAFFIIPSTRVSPEFLASDNPRNILSQAFSPLYTLSKVTSSTDLFGSLFHMGPIQYDYPLKTIFNKGAELPLLMDETGFLDHMRLFNNKLVQDIDRSAFDFPLILESLIPTSSAAFNQLLPFQRNFFLRRADLPVPYYYLGVKLREYDQFLELYTHRGLSYIGHKVDQWDADQRLRHLTFRHIPYIPFNEYQDHPDYTFSWKRYTWALNIKFFFERKKIHPADPLPDLKAARLHRERKRKEEQDEFVALATQLGKNPYDESISEDSPYRYILEENPALGTLHASDDPAEEHRYYKMHISKFDMGSLHTVNFSKRRVRVKGRKRGRPRNEVAVADIPTVKRPRGRPKKQVDETSVSSIKRPRGRPRKDGSIVAPVSELNVSIIKRPRGRPRKVKVELPADAIEKESVEELPYEDILLS
jgi:hypothetical protein